MLGSGNAARRTIKKFYASGIDTAFAVLFQHKRDAFNSLDLSLFQSSVTTGNNNDGIWIELMYSADDVPAFLVRMFGYGAGVNNADIHAAIAELSAKLSLHPSVATAIFFPAKSPIRVSFRFQKSRLKRRVFLQEED